MLVVKKYANFFAENWRKSLKIVSITSTPGLERTSKWRYELRGMRRKSVDLKSVDKLKKILERHL
jgi:hypothetical protein